jgi:hypothetical protein
MAGSKRARGSVRTPLVRATPGRPYDLRRRGHERAEAASLQRVGDVPPDLMADMAELTAALSKKLGASRLDLRPSAAPGDGRHSDSGDKTLPPRPRGPRDFFANPQAGDPAYIAKLGLSKRGKQQAHQAGRLLATCGQLPDIVHTSVQSRTFVLPGPRSLWPGTIAASRQAGAGGRLGTEGTTRR